MPQLRCVECGSFNIAQGSNADVTKHKGGKPPFGFKVVDGSYTFSPQGGGRVLVWFMREHANGYSYRALAIKAVAQGWKAPAGGEWTHSIVRRVVEQGKRLSALIPLEYVV